VYLRGKARARLYRQQPDAGDHPHGARGHLLAAAAWVVAARAFMPRVFYGVMS
jgi:hypothetical protein